MKRVPFKAVLITLIGLVAVGSLVSQAPALTSPNSTQTLNQTCTGSGVTLVIDFGEAIAADKAGSQNYCVKDFAGSGWQLFEAAGVDVGGTAEYPQSFVCRVLGTPSKESEDCLGTPNFSTGTWVYYVASADSNQGGWVRSGAGAAMRKPKCGDYEGWRFVSGFAEANLPPRTPANPFRCQ